MEQAEFIPGLSGAQTSTGSCEKSLSAGFVKSLFVKTGQIVQGLPAIAAKGRAVHHSKNLRTQCPELPYRWPGIRRQTSRKIDIFRSGCRTHDITLPNRLRIPHLRE